jgi:hypothetical protein
MSVKRLFVTMLIVGILGYVLSACIAFASTPEHFDLNRPPEGWHRFVHPDINYAIWLPEDWIAAVPPKDSDVKLNTLYLPPGESGRDIYATVNFITYVDFVEDPRDPLGWQAAGIDELPESTYSLDTVELVIPCARYDITSLRHVCIVGPYPEEQYFPLRANPELAGFALYLRTTAEAEADLLPIWQSMVVSFALEQPPEIVHKSEQNP